MIKLSASNLAWDITWDDQVLRLMAELGYGAVEIAPTKLWGNWQDISLSDVKSYAHKLKEYGLQASAFQSVLFDVPFSLLDHRNIYALLDHFKNLCYIAEQIDCRVLIVGSPGLRRLRMLNYKEAVENALAVFSDIGEVLKEFDIVIGLEANPPEYGCDFLTTQAEIAEFVATLGHNQIKEHLDLGALIVNQDLNIVDHLTRDLVHIHVSAPKLAPLQDLSSELKHLFSHISGQEACWVSAEILNLKTFENVENDLTLLREWANR